MGGRSAFAGLQVLLLITWAAPALSQPGYLSIDCGSDVNYTDRTTGIHWVTDANYISTGTNAQNLSVFSFDPSRPLLNKKQAETLRYFDEGRSRDCYVLPTTPGRIYLVRPTFYYGDWANRYAANNTFFHIYLNNTFWFAQSWGDDYINDETSWGEGIVYSPGSQLNFCIVGVDSVGPPFISSLELRELSSGMYSTEVESNIFLDRHTRLNCGASLSGPPYLRYPDDLHDRLWSTEEYNSSYTDISRTNMSAGSSTHAPDQPPAKVMQDAWVYYNQSSLTYVEYPELYDGIYNISVHTYFQELDGNASASNVRGMEYYFNGKFITSFSVSDQPLEIMRMFNVTASEGRGGIFDITLVQANWSKLSPILNAIEIFFVNDFDISATMTEDVYTIATLQTQLNVTYWGGDPCFPVPYDWLHCSTNTTARVTQLCLQNLSMTDVVPGEILNLVALTSLDLSNNRYAAFPTNFSLKELSNLTVLDVSQNNLNGEVQNFLDAIDLATIRKINAADNQFDGEIPVNLLVAEAAKVEIVNFDRNHINGTLNLFNWYTSFLHAVKYGNPPSLQVLSLVDNNIMDIYPSVGILTPYIEKLLKAGNKTILDTGILLGGNPCCGQAKLTMSVAQQYLCRFTTKDHINTTGRASSSWNGKKLGVIIGPSVGTFILLLSSICFAFLWKLRKQTHALQEIQEALAKQKVQPPFYSFAELRAATRDFSPGNKLGHGTFGTVYKAVLGDGTILAVKKQFPSKLLALTEFLNEVVLITGIKHRNLIQLRGCCIQEQQRLLVYEYAENGNLAEALWDATNKKDGEVIWRETKLDWRQRFNICVGVARGLAYLHEELQPCIIHRDIKPANILLDKNLNPKIADFGLARPFLDDQSRADYSNLAGTPGYCAPEYVSQGQLTEKVDVFSFGILVLEIVSGRPCINRKLPGDEVFLLSWTTNLRIEERLSDLLEREVRESCINEEDVLRVINIALLCVHMDPARRPTMTQVVTMLLGSMDVTVFLDRLQYNRPDFRSLQGTPAQSPLHSKLATNLQTLSEENDQDSLLDMDFMNASTSFSSSRGGSFLMRNLSARS